MILDFPVAGTVTVASDAELREALASHPAVRLAGTGSAQTRIPAPDVEVTVVSLAGMSRILRLETDDLTCSVEPGVRRDDLDRELAARGLWLPCAGTGSLGGIFAGDEVGPLAPGQPEPRSLLLGMTGMLSEGKRFRAGARVVKNVAGFDLQKLFVGSRGRLFAVTELHLKLRPRPRGVMHFACEDLTLDEARARLRDLRRHPTRPAEVRLDRRGPERYAVHGSVASDPSHLDRWATELRLPRVASAEADPVAESPRPEGIETLRGAVRPGHLPALLDLLPGDAPFALIGERFTTQVPREATDRILARLPELPATAEVVIAAAERRGMATPTDPASARLTEGLRQTLDPRGVLR